MDALWSLALPIEALRAAPAEFARHAALLAAGVALSFGLLRGTSRPILRGGLVLLLWGAFFWTLRDTLHLMGDGQLWIQMLQRAGLAAPAYHEILSVRLLGLLATATDGTRGNIHRLLGVVSIVSGLVVLVALLVLAARHRAGSGVVGVAAATPALFWAYGGVETSGPFLALLALCLLRLHVELPAGRLTRPTLVLLALLPGFHISGVLVLPAVALALVPGAPPTLPVAAAGAVLAAAAGAVLAALLPWTRAQSTFGVAWTAPALVSALADLAQGTLLVALPYAPLLVRRPALAGGRVAVFRVAATVLLFAFPLIGRFRLGAYRDLNLFAPLGLILLAAAVTAPPPESGWRRLATLGAIAFGVAQLAALLTFGHAPAGVDYFTRRLEQAPIADNDRAYGFETLALVAGTRGEPAAARHALQRATALDPGNDRLAGMLGALDLAAGDTALAIERLTRGLRSVRRRDVSILLAGVELRLGRPRRALDHLAVGWDDAPPDRTVGSLLCAAYLAVGAPDSALGVARLRLDSDPEDAAAWFNQGVALWTLEGPAAARISLENAARLMPENPAFRERLARLDTELPSR